MHPVAPAASRCARSAAPFRATMSTGRSRVAGSARRASRTAGRWRPGIIQSWIRRSGAASRASTSASSPTRASIARSWMRVSLQRSRRKSSSPATRTVFIARPCPCSIDAMRPALEQSEWRAAAWLALVAALAYLPFNHCHFSGTDETGVFDPALSLYTRGTLAVEQPGMHIFPGRDGRLYSHFAIAQTILALPFVALGDVFARALGPERVRAGIGRDESDSIDTRES